MVPISVKFKILEDYIQYEKEPATVPGPQIRVKKGDLVRIVIKNNSTQPHSLHPHGITSVVMLNDGVPHNTGNYILPGKSYTNEFVVAKEAGAHWYHCHVQHLFTRIWECTDH